MIIYFPENDIRVSVEAQPDGRYSAIDADHYDGPGSPMGWGDTQMEAIADLAEQLAEK